MSISYKNLLLPTIVLLSVASAFALVSIKGGATSLSRPGRESTVEEEPVDQSSNAAASDSEMYVQMAQLWPQLRPALQAIGDRLEKPGNERIRLIGSLVRSDEAQSRPVQITSEFSGRLRLEEQTSETARVLTFNEDGVGVTNGAPEQLDRAVIETLVYDSPEHFFIGQMGAAATRFLGSRFRPDDGEAENYAGPFYDIYQTTEQVRIGLEAREQTKLYYFNSDTRLLERVLYTLSHDGSESSVEIQLSDWREIEGQKVPGRIIRLENNAPMLTFSLTPSSIGSRAEDGIFKTEQ